MVIPGSRPGRERRVDQDAGLRALLDQSYYPGGPTLRDLTDRIGRGTRVEGSSLPHALDVEVAARETIERAYTWQYKDPERLIAACRVVVRNIEARLMARGRGGS